MKKFKKPKMLSVAKEMKSEPVKTKIKKKKDNSANLYLHPAKLPSGDKIGASTTVKMTKQKRLKMRAQKGAHLNV
jgi:hypothetical protein